MKTITVYTLPRCEDHPTFEGPTCRCCWSEIKTGQRPESALGKHHEETPA